MVATWSLLVLLLTACNPPTTVPSSVEPTPTTEPTPVSPVPTTPEREAPLLSGAVKRGCQAPGSAGFANVGLDEGATAVDFTLKDTRENEVSLPGLLRERPVAPLLANKLLDEIASVEKTGDSDTAEMKPALLGREMETVRLVAEGEY